MAAIVIAKGLSVRDTEKLAKTVRDPDQKQQKRRPFEKDPDTRALEADLSASLGMAVSIAHEPGGEAGVISIRYNSLEELDALCQALSVVRRDILAR